MNAASLDTARLAAPLLRLASRVVGDVPPREARNAVAAVRAFAEAPSPARYLAATRALRDTERRHKLNKLGRAMGGQRLDQGLDVLARSSTFAPELMDALRSLPFDARNGRRLAIISDLLVAQRLIEARAVGGLHELRQALGPVPISANRRRKPRRPAAG
jgi:hypothetical protein